MNIVHPKTFYFGFAVAILGVIVLAMRMNLDWFWHLHYLTPLHFIASPIYVVGMAMLCIGSYFRKESFGVLQILIGAGTICLNFLSGLHTVLDYLQNGFISQNEIGMHLVMLMLMYFVCALALIGPSVAKSAPISPNRTFTGN